ncbi:HAMP domain-containing histidine kinase [Candidatus Woesearchaeota archaeon]|nr:HAMP domain-containing histidine kinase [Candidatus Woesearchaeota archaeon]
MNKIAAEEDAEITKEIADAANAVMLPLTLSTTVLALIIAYIISYKISSPIIQLHKATQELEKGNFKARVDIKTGDELEQFGNTLNKAIERLEKSDKEHKQLDQAKTKFLSITSHELRSPMTPMKAQLQMLMGNYFGKLNKKQKDSVDIVLRNTTRLDSIIEDFLEISRIEAARLKFKFIKTNLAGHINRLVNEMKGFMPEKNIKIITEIDKLPIIEVDPGRVMQVLRNLINNAIKFSSKNSKILVNVELKNNAIEFAVKDQGIGLSPANQKRLFEPFFQAEQTMYRQYGGTGLGLAICKGIVESQDGRMWIESKEGKETIFYFTVPLEPVREMKPIKLLFSENEGIEKKLKEIFIEYLGPLGEQEFEKLNKITANSIIGNINELEKIKVLNALDASQFRDSVMGIFRQDAIQNSNTISPEKLAELSLIKKTKHEIEIAKLEKLAKKRKLELNYEKLIQNLIQNVFYLYGQVAIDKANLIENITVDEKGKIKEIKGDKKQILNKLGFIYTDLVGDLGKFIKKKELRKILAKNKIIQE